MKIGRLKLLGIEEFKTYLDSFSLDKSSSYPAKILTDSEYTDIIQPEIEIELRKFETRLAFAEYLYNLFKGKNIENIHHDKGLWSWLSLFYFDELCPPDSKGRRNPGQTARWIPETGVSWRYYRHLLAGPYRIYSAHADNPKRASLVLCGPLNKPGDIVEQLASRQEIITNQGVMEAAANLYFDPEINKPKRGAATKSGKGNVRRFTDILNQFDVTWDLYSLESGDVFNLLPQEFSRFSDAIS